MKLLGSGGMGVVYLAEQSSLGRRVALKLIRPEQRYFPGVQERFAREANAIARLSHPGIVPVHAVGEESGVPYLAMELVAGTSLAAVITRLQERGTPASHGSDLYAAVVALSHTAAVTAEQALPPYSLNWADACVWVAREVAQALEHAHQRGVLHRDVKPSNVMLTPSGRVMLVDFGLATTPDADTVTRPGWLIGSLRYMAPEQIDARAKDVDERTDVYGVAVTLYELLALKAPFAGEEFSSLRRAICDGRAPRLRSLVHALPRDVETVVSVGMMPEQARRYASGADLARDLTHVLQREPIEARPSGPWLQLARWTQRHPAAAALALTVLLIAPLVFGFQQAHAADRIREQRDAANLNFGRAVEAVDTMLTQVGGETLLWVPQMESVRHDLLEEALGFYDQFVEERGDDSDVLLRRARTEVKVARIRAELGDASAAERTLASAVAALRELERHQPDVAAFDGALAQALAERANVLSRLGRTAESEQDYRDAIAGAERGLARDGADADAYRAAIVDAHRQLAVLLRDAGRTKEAGECARRAADELRRALERAPDDVALQRRLAEALAVWANLLARTAPLRETEQRFNEAVTLARRTLERDPEHPPLRETLGASLGALGGFLSEQHFASSFTPSGPTADVHLAEAVLLFEGLAAEFPKLSRLHSQLATFSTNLSIHLARSARFAEAEPHAKRAVAVLTRLAELAPDVLKHASDLGGALNNLAMFEIQRGDEAAALPLLGRAIELQSRALAAQPDNAIFRRHLGNHYKVRHDALSKLGRWREAADAAQRAADNWPDRRAAYLAAAERLVAYSRAAGADTALSDQERAAETARLWDQAIACLRSSVEAGLDRSKLEANDKLAPLRHQPSFRALVANED